jgi:hypothetical protein
VVVQLEGYLKKSDIPTTKNGIVGKRQTGLPIGKLYSFNEDKEVLEEEITTGNDIIDTLLGIFISFNFILYEIFEKVWLFCRCRLYS